MRLTLELLRAARVSRLIARNSHPAAAGSWPGRRLAWGRQPRHTTSGHRLVLAPEQAGVMSQQQQQHRTAAAAAGAAPPAAEGGSAAAAAPATESAVLDRDQFRQQLLLRALRIPTKQCQHYMAVLSKHLLNKPRIRNIQDVEGDPDHKLLLLGEGLTAEELAALQVKRGEQALTVGQLMEADGLQVTEAQVEVDYSYWPATQVLQRLLPEGSEVPSSFEAVGDIAHMNLREELLPWKFVVGQVILDKNPRLRSVVNKVGTIENEWRVFDMEVLASREPGWVRGAGCRMETEVRQHKARFKLDFSKVYWNSRLETEHHRLVGGFQPGEVVLDVMAGIGPFAVPAAQKGCTVWANDLNPDSFRWLRTNIVLNKVSERVIPFNLDGREVIRLAARGALPLAEAAAAAAAAAAAGKKGKPKQPKPQQEQATGAGAAAAAAGQATNGAGPAAAQQQPAAPAPAVPAAGGLFEHAVMNLPASAVEFLDAYRGAFDPELWAGQPLPMVHVYTFCKNKEEDEAGMQRRVEAALGGPLDAPPAFHLVRDVAPNKKMYCVSFRVPQGVAFAAGEGAAGTKRQKVA